MNAEIIARALKGHKSGRGWTARCPAHKDDTPSLSITEKNGKVLVRCFAGCEQQDVIAALRARDLWTESSRPTTRCTPIEREPDQDDAKRSEVALAIWRATLLGESSLVETYLRSRKIVAPVPAALRFHPGLKHPSGGNWPVMVALITNGKDGTPLAIHRTFLSRDGGGKAPVEPQKMMLGPVRGGVVHLADPDGDGPLLIGEGIETCLAAMLASGRPAWAALSTSGLRALDLPEDVHDVIVLADGDDAGEAAARDCAWRWKREGRRVRIARPPQGFDFNDLLMGRAPCIEEGAQ
jgi:putative DNA primase/helicase